jgi:hypothetical protein
MGWHSDRPVFIPTGPLWKRLRQLWKRLGKRRRSRVRPVSGASTGRPRSTSSTGTDATSTPSGRRESIPSATRLSVTLPGPMKPLTEATA